MEGRKMEGRRGISFGAMDRAPAIGFISAIIQSFLARRAFFLMQGSYRDATKAATSILLKNRENSSPYAESVTEAT
jgi:hypothetical protein